MFPAKRLTGWCCQVPSLAAFVQGALANSKVPFQSIFRWLFLSLDWCCRAESSAFGFFGFLVMPGWCFTHARASAGFRAAPLQMCRMEHVEEE